jgi:hypothetical protein
MVVTRALPITQTQQRIQIGYDVKLCPWQVLDSEDDPPLLMLRMMMMGTAPGAADPVVEDEAKADYLRQAHG